jgi:hypothetical protein
MLQIANVLSSSSLQGVVDGSVFCIHHRGYVDVNVLDSAISVIAKRFTSHKEAGDKEPRSLGAVVGDAMSSPEHARQYFATAVPMARMIRDEIFGPLLSPIDRLRLDLDECWPFGSMVGRIDGQQMVAATLRWFISGDRMAPHIDRSNECLIDDLCKMRRLAANIYLQVPAEGNGGEFEIWNFRPSADDFDDKARSMGAFNRQQLGQPAWTIRPEAGDLIVFDTAFVHAARRVENGFRLTASCFIAVRGQDQPICMFG